MVWCSYIWIPNTLVTLRRKSFLRRFIPKPKFSFLNSRFGWEWGLLIISTKLLNFEALSMQRASHLSMSDTSLHSQTPWTYLLHWLYHIQSSYSYIAYVEHILPCPIPPPLLFYFYCIIIYFNIFKNIFINV